MNEYDKKLITILGKNLGDVAVALLEIIHALKKQPGFDRAAFDTHIRERLPELDQENPIAKKILGYALDHPRIR
jgi:hypothetical protein